MIPLTLHVWFQSQVRYLVRSPNIVRKTAIRSSATEQVLRKPHDYRILSNLGSRFHEYSTRSV